jgi:hypothetical protein
MRNCPAVAESGQATDMEVGFSLVPCYDSHSGGGIGNGALEAANNSPDKVIDAINSSADANVEDAAFIDPSENSDIWPTGDRSSIDHKIFYCARRSNLTEQARPKTPYKGQASDRVVIAVVGAQEL